MSTSTQKSITSQWTHIDQCQDTLPKFYEYEMPTSFRTPVTFDDELDDGDFEYEAALMEAFANEEEEEDKTVVRLRQILDHMNPLYNTPLTTTITDIKTSSL